MAQTETSTAATEAGLNRWGTDLHLNYLLTLEHVLLQQRGP